MSDLDRALTWIARAREALDRLDRCAMTCDGLGAYADGIGALQRARLCIEGQQRRAVISADSIEEIICHHQGDTHA